MAISKLNPTAGGSYINISKPIASAATTAATTSFPAGNYIAIPNTITNAVLTIGSFTKQFTSTDRASQFSLTLDSSASSATITHPSSNIGWLPTNSTIPTYANAIVYDGTKFVVCDQSGNITTTTDAVTWTTAVNSGTGDNRHSIAYNSGVTQKYVCAGDGGALSSSTDAVTWTSRTSGFGATVIYGVAAGSNASTTKYIAVGGAYNGVAAIVKYSTDGITWSNATTAFGNGGQNAGFGLNLYFAGSQTGLGSSTDGVTWTTRLSSLANESAGIFLANGLMWHTRRGGEVYNSTDGITWTLRKSAGGTFSIGMTGLVYFSGAYYGNIANANGTYYSTDGITWVQRAANAIGITDNGPTLATNGTIVLTPPGVYSSTGNAATTIASGFIFNYTGSAIAAS